MGNFFTKNLIKYLNSFLRKSMIYGLSGSLPLYIVTEYPKSGGSWFSQMLSDYLEVPFPHNKLPRFESCVMHGHYLYFSTMKNVFVVLRDGRDVMVSYYFHSYFKNDRSNSRLVKRMKKELSFKNYENVIDNLPKFIEYKMTNRKTRPKFTWPDFINNWIVRNVTFVKYEDLLRDPVLTMTECIKGTWGLEVDHTCLKAIVDKYSFKNLTKREQGKEDKKSFLRKGIAGDWKNYFNKESKEVFNRYAGDKLIELGYEKDDSWIK